MNQSCSDGRCNAVPNLGGVGEVTFARHRDVVCITPAPDNTAASPPGATDLGATATPRKASGLGFRSQTLAALPSFSVYCSNDLGSPLPFRSAPIAVSEEQLFPNEEDCDVVSLCPAVPTAMPTREREVLSNRGASLTSPEKEHALTTSPDSGVASDESVVISDGFSSTSGGVTERPLVATASDPLKKASGRQTPFHPVLSDSILLSLSPSAELPSVPSIATPSEAVAITTHVLKETTPVKAPDVSQDVSSASPEASQDRVGVLLSRPLIPISVDVDAIDGCQETKGDIYHPHRLHHSGPISIGRRKKAVFAAAVAPREARRSGTAGAAVDGAIASDALAARQARRSSTADAAAAAGRAGGGSVASDADGSAAAVLGNSGAGPDAADAARPVAAGADAARGHSGSAVSAGRAGGGGSLNSDPFRFLKPLKRLGRRHSAGKAEILTFQDNAAAFIQSQPHEDQQQWQQQHQVPAIRSFESLGQGVSPQVSSITPFSPSSSPIASPPWSAKPPHSLNPASQSASPWLIHTSALGPLSSSDTHGGPQQCLTYPKSASDASENERQQRSRSPQLGFRFFSKPHRRSDSQSSGSTGGGGGGGVGAVRSSSSSTSDGAGSLQGSSGATGEHCRPVVSSWSGDIATLAAPCASPTGTSSWREQQQRQMQQLRQRQQRQHQQQQAHWEQDTTGQSSPPLPLSPLSDGSSDSYPSSPPLVFERCTTEPVLHKSTLSPTSGMGGKVADAEEFEYADEEENEQGRGF
ncbi:hypothetical protein CLOM_g1927 [Closterium sp. NIES-68]|nr:hypothetical protein CLOM_g1927 [Closterium sp. NIES-68]